MRRAGRRPSARRIGVLLLVVLVAAALAAFALAACGNADPFAGLYWEPSSGRRVEIRKDGDAYRLYYGAAKEPYRATRNGDELTIHDPMGGDTIIRPGDQTGTLTLETGGETTVLKQLPQHQ